MIVIGGGPAGYTAALYAARSGIDTMVLEKMSVGGQMTETTQIDNYPGFNQGIDGFELGERMKSGSERFGAKSRFSEVLSVDLRKDIKEIKTSEGKFLAKTVVIATGAKHRHLGIDKEEYFIGKGLGYCAACDGMFYKGKTVAIVGGGNSAAADAMILSRICKKVILIHRRDALRATKVYHEPLKKAENIEFCWNSVICELLGEDRISGVMVENVKTNEICNLQVEGVFVSIGRSPETQLFKGQIDIDENGYIIADESTRTNIPGVFAAGDVRTKSLRQIITAAADGAVAAQWAEGYLSAKM